MRFVRSRSGIPCGLAGRLGRSSCGTMWRACVWNGVLLYSSTKRNEIINFCLRHSRAFWWRCLRFASCCGSWTRVFFCIEATENGSTRRVLCPPQPFVSLLAERRLAMLAVVGGRRWVPKQLLVRWLSGRERADTGQDMVRWIYWSGRFFRRFDIFRPCASQLRRILMRNFRCRFTKQQLSVVSLVVDWAVAMALLLENGRVECHNTMSSLCIGEVLGRSAECFHSEFIWQPPTKYRHSVFEWYLNLWKCINYWTFYESNKIY